MLATTIPDAKPGVREAIEQIARAYSDHDTEVLGEPQGGAWVLVHDLDVGERVVPSRSWIGFGIAFQYPYTDVYPHFLVPDLAFADGRPFAPPLNPGQLMPGFNRSATMLSRRSSNWSPATDTALLKLQRILAFLRRDI